MEKIKEATRARCEIIQLSSRNMHEYIPIKLNFFPLIRKFESIDFSIYFLIGWELIEFITPKEWSFELYEQVYHSALKGKDGSKICLSKSQYPLYENLVSTRKKEILNKILKKDHTLDKNTLQLYHNTSLTSQIIVRGGLDVESGYRISKTASDLATANLNITSTLTTLTKLFQLAPCIYDHETVTTLVVATLIHGLNWSEKVTKRQSKLALQAALLHDIDKYCSKNIEMNKANKTDIGSNEILKIIEAGAPIHKGSLLAIKQHHENYDGSGPYSLQGRAKSENDENEGIQLEPRLIKIGCEFAKILMELTKNEKPTPLDILKKMKEKKADHLDEEIFAALYNELEAPSEEVNPPPK